MLIEKSPPPGPASGGANAWVEIEGLIREIAQLTRTDLAAPEFYAALLDRTVRGLAAAGGAVWTHAGHFSHICQIRLDDCLPGDPDSRQRHQGLLITCLGQTHARLLPPTSSASEAAGNPSPYSALLAPVILGEDLMAVIEIFQRPGASPAAQQGYPQFLAAVCELATEYERNRELQSLQDKAAVWGLFEDFMLRLLGATDRRSLAFAVVNEGRRLVPCDRLSLAIRTGRTCRVEAVSGLDSLDRRANAVRHLERLAEVVTPDEPLWFEGDASQLDPPVQAALERYLPDSKARMVAVVPLTVSVSGIVAVQLPSLRSTTL